MTSGTKENLLIGVVAILLAYTAIIKKVPMIEDFDVPEFMKPQRIRCATKGCMKKVHRDSDKCLDCEFEEALPQLHDEIDAMQAGK